MNTLVLITKATCKLIQPCLAVKIPPKLLSMGILTAKEHELA